MLVTDIKKLYSLLDYSDKKFILILLILTIILSCIETLSVSSIMPFISMASNPEIIHNGFYNKIYTYLNFNSTTSFIVACGLSLIFLYIFRSVYNIVYSYLLYRFSFGSYHKFAYNLFRNYVYLSYKDFVFKNSAVLTKTIVSEANHLSVIVLSVLMLLSELFTVLFLYILLICVNWKMTLVLSCILGIKVLLLTKYLSKTIKKQGIKRSDVQEAFLKTISETFGNFKLVKLNGNEKKIFDSFEYSSKEYARSNLIYNTISTLPKGILEAIGFSSLIATVIYILLVYRDVSFVIPIISMYALALYRMLPAINRVLHNYNSIAYLSKSLDIVYGDLTYSVIEEGFSGIEFQNNIQLKNVSFGYNDNTNVLNNINLNIAKGDKVAFVGKSGSGKSTIIDIILGIYKSTSGVLMVDNKVISNENVKSWRLKFGYIPQSVYLFDGTVADNVAFGKEFNEAKIIESLKKANIYDFLCTKKGINTQVGEGGIQLSGGQKQRIGIARALYGDPEILVLDEATSALDHETEAAIMDEIYAASQDKTLLIIAHRLSTVEKCTRKITIDSGCLYE